jgi:hypothetical protein
VNLTLDRFTASAESEEPPVTTPRPRYSAAPWWAAVPGLDPAVPVGDWAAAAHYTALACSVHVAGTAAVFRTALLPTRKSMPVADRFLGWLLEAGDPDAAARRRFALRLACDEAPDLETDDLLRLADAFRDTLTPGRR